MTNSMQQHTTESDRIYSLDALRGLAILLMVLSGVIARKVLPNWMYHAQVPPPNHVFDPTLPGLTWVDLVFPLFLFCMGTAFPIALKSFQSNKKEGLKKIGIRFFNLSAFAILLQHVRPGNLGELAQSSTWWFALLGFMLLFLMFTKWPNTIKETYQKGLTVLGWIGMLLLVFVFPYAKSTGFDFYRSDIILIVLADMALFGGLIWLFTAKITSWRWIVLVMYAALRLSATQESWIKDLWSFSPADWLMKWDYLKYLFIVIPGMYAGEWLLKSKTEPIQQKIKNSSFNGLIVLILSLVLILLIGLQSRQVFLTTLMSSVICVIIYQVSLTIWNKESAINQLIKASIFWIVLGLLFEPFDGGIKKDPSSFTYWMITSGISGFLLLFFYVLIDLKKQTNWKWFIQNGQNPMIAYVAFANLVWPVLALTGIEHFINQLTQSPLLGFVRGLLYTALVAFITKFFTQHKLYWKT